MHSSVTSGSDSSGRSERRVSVSEEPSVETDGLARGASGAEFIDGSEVEITRDQNLDAIALAFGEGRRDVDCAPEHLGEHSLRGGWVHDHGTALTWGMPWQL